jgi:hypothetical protein
MGKTYKVHLALSSLAQVGSNSRIDTDPSQQCFALLFRSGQAER